MRCLKTLWWSVRPTTVIFRPEHARLSPSNLTEFCAKRKEYEEASLTVSSVCPLTKIFWQVDRAGEWYWRSDCNRNKDDENGERQLGGMDMRRFYTFDDYRFPWMADA